ncbi:MAG: hypothetical protein ACO31Z_05760 [Litorivicinaceae bacterium]
MELKRVIAKDNKAAMDQVVALYGPDALVVSGHRVRNQFELIVAVDIEPDLNPPGDDEDTWPLAAADTGDAQADDATVDPAPVLQTERAATAETAPVFRKVLFEPEQTPAAQAALARHVAASLQSRTGAEQARDAFRAQEVVELIRSEIQVLRQEIQLQHQTAPWWARVHQEASLNPLAEQLMMQPIPGRLKTLLVDAIADLNSVEAAHIQLENILIEHLAVSQFDLTDYQGIHAFYGPSGVGKTTFVGKLAVSAALEFGAEQVVLISHLDHKLGAWNQTQMIAAEAGIRCYRATSQEMMQTLIDALSDRTCVLIDTAGVQFMATREQLGTLHGDVLHHLLVAAETSQSTLRKCQFTADLWDSLNLTKLDESTALWNVIDTLIAVPSLAIRGCSSSPSVNTTLEGTSLRALVDAVLSTLDSGPVSSAMTEPAETTKASRQEQSELTTMEFLTGLSATSADRVTDPRRSRH